MGGPRIFGCAGAFYLLWREKAAAWPKAALYVQVHVLDAKSAMRSFGSASHICVFQARYLSTMVRMASQFSSMSCTSLNCVRARSRFWRGRWMWK